MANYSAGILGVPFNAEVDGEIACAAMIVAAGGLRTEARRDDRPPEDQHTKDYGEDCPTAKVG